MHTAEHRGEESEAAFHDDWTEKEVSVATGSKRVLRLSGSGLMPARRGFVGRERFALGQVPRSLSALAARSPVGKRGISRPGKEKPVHMGNPG
jgi:hypothetical protein